MKWNLIPFNSPEICGNCNIEKNCHCSCHIMKIASGYHELIEGRKIEYITIFDKLRHFIVVKFRLKVARV